MFFYAILFLFICRSYYQQGVLFLVVIVLLMCVLFSLLLMSYLKKIIVIKWSNSNFGLYIMLMHYNHRFVRSELDLAFTPERCTYYIQLITDTLWPEGVLDTNVYEPSPEQCKVTREQAKRCLQNFFPGNTVISKIYKMN